MNDKIKKLIELFKQLDEQVRLNGSIILRIIAKFLGCFLYIALMVRLLILSSQGDLAGLLRYQTELLIYIFMYCIWYLIIIKF